MANDISTDELKQAYQAAGLRFKGWGFVRSIQTPSMLAALRGMAAARRLKQQPQLHAATNRERRQHEHRDHMLAGQDGVRRGGVDAN